MNEKINNDLKEAMKCQNKFTLAVLRMLKSAIIYESRNGESHELSDDEILSLIKKQIKTKKADIEEFSKYNRNDLVEELEREIKLLQTYLPKELSDEELNKVINQVFEEVNPTSMKEMGLVIKTIASRVGASADMGKVSQIVKAKMS